MSITNAFEEIAGHDVLATRLSTDGTGPYYVVEFDSLIKEFVTWSPAEGHETKEAAMEYAREWLPKSLQISPAKRIVDGKVVVK